MFKFILLCYIYIGTHSVVRSQKNEEFPTIDNIIQGLKEEVWTADETPCLQKTLELLHNVKNFTLWATWIWDANRLPSNNLYGSSYQLGNFDQCMNPPWLDTHPQFKTQYCTGEVVMVHKKFKRGVFDPYASTEVYMKTITRLGQLVNRYTWGVCTLASCQPSSVAKIMKHMYLATHFRFISNPNITVFACEAAGTKEEFTVEYYLFVCTLVTLSIIAIGSTYYRKHRESQTNLSDSIVGKILESFCMVKNSSELTKSYKNEIKALNGIRTFTSVGVVLLHIVNLHFISGCANTGDFDNRILFLDKLLNLSFVVDSFFVMSGLLHVKSLLGRNQINVFVIIWKRYVRLIGMFALTIYYNMYVGRFHGSGPFWKGTFDGESAVCKENWWLSMLMLNSSGITCCYAVTWYIACDFQYTVLATLIVYLYKKNKRLGIFVFGVAAVTSVAIPGVLTYWFKLKAFYFLNIEHVLQTRSDPRITYTYMRSYSRAGTYVVGMCLGYIMHIYKPAVYKQKLSELYSTFGTILSLILMLFPLYLGSFFIERDYNVVEEIFVAMFNRSIWAIGVCGIIALCEYGKIRLLTDFFSLSFFIPLSKLSYGTYLVHFLVIQQTKKIMVIKVAPIFDIFAAMVDTVGIAVVSWGISYVLWLIFEAPLNNLSDRFITNRFVSKEVAPSVQKKTERENTRSKQQDSLLK